MAEGLQTSRKTGLRALAWTVAVLVVAGLAALAWLRFHRARGHEEGQGGEEAAAAPPPAVPPAQVNRWKEAARLVEEDRGEPVGRSARIHIPPELRHYPDRRRFLAVQVAAWMEKDYAIPHDDADLARMIASGDFVEVPAVGDHYVLYGVGANATGEPFTHEDRATGAEIPLYGRYDLFEDAEAETQERIEEKQTAAAEATAQAAKLPKAQARKRRALLAQARKARQEAAAMARQQKAALAWYQDPEKRRMLVAEWQSLEDLALRIGKRPYDLDDPKQRRAFRGLLLTHLRPAARDTLLELAARYDERFHRPLPVTSLVRTLAYQRQLGETNPNATHIEIPPHTTGLAFDVYDHYMSGPEQDGLMEMVAQLEKDGRVEALRENRDHIHMLAFPDGRRPPESLVARALGVVRPGTRVATAARPSARPKASASPHPATTGKAALRGSRP